jgi:shikimate 5-dehydrogenase
LRDSIAQSYLLINATSVGMVPDIDDTIIKDTSLFRPELVVADVVYEPQETRLLREAKAAGCQTFNGMYMLLHQGAKAFQIWTGQEMPVSVIKEKYFSVK